MLRSVISALLFAFASFSAVSAQDLQKAEQLYQKTHYQESLSLLNKNSSDPATLFLLGRDYFMLSDFHKATDYIEKATQADPKNSEYLDWLGRVYGKRAATGNPLAAMGLASKTRQAFERSVDLNPRNGEALDDLFDFYLEAPGIIGGGTEKAEAVAQKILAFDPPEAYYDLAKVARKRNDFQSEERYLRQAARGSGYPGHKIALAKFLARQGRIAESDEVFRQAQADNPDAANIWFQHADLLIRQKRNLDEARLLLQKYIGAPITVDDPPKEEAYRLLKQAGGA